MMTTATRPPTYEQVSRGFGFPVPLTYYRLIEIAFEMNPRDPWNAFDPLDIVQVDATRANPTYIYSGHDYASTPVEVCVIGWTGTDGVHYGFVVDDLPSTAHELPIVEIAPIECEYRLLGTSIADFLNVRLAEAIRYYGNQWQDNNSMIISKLVNEFGVKSEASVEAIVREAAMRRRRDGAVLTAIDACGAIVPRSHVDWEYWDSIDWEILARDRRLPNELLEEAEHRLAEGDFCTSLLVAKNLWILYWRAPMANGEIWLRRSGEIMSKGYEQLGRPHLAAKARALLNWVLHSIVRPQPR